MRALETLMYGDRAFGAVRHFSEAINKNILVANGTHLIGNLFERL